MFRFGNTSEEMNKASIETIKQNHSSRSFQLILFKTFEMRQIFGGTSIPIKYERQVKHNVKPLLHCIILIVKSTTMDHFAGSTIDVLNRIFHLLQVKLRNLGQGS